MRQQNYKLCVVISLRRRTSFYETRLFLTFGAGLKELPAIAAKPATSPPMNAVTSINKMDDPPNLKSSAILCETVLPFLLSIQNVNSAHNKKMPAKPEKNELLIVCGINKATRKATRAMLHHSSRSPARKASDAVSNIAKINLIVLISVVSKS